MVLELEKCADCGTPYLTATDDTDRLRPRRLPPDIDEFAATSDTEAEVPDPEADTAEAPPAAHYTRLIAGAARPGLATLTIDRHTGAFAERAGEGLAIHATSRRAEAGACPACEAEGQLRPFRFGAPFLIGNAAPVMLDGVTGQAANLPGEGRRLLSFTDSRQGTARFAANIETLSERGYVRSLLYHMAQKAGAEDPAKAAALNLEIAEFEKAVKSFPALAGELERKRQQRDELGAGGGVPWTNAVQALSQDAMIDQWVRREVWARRDTRFAKANSTDFARFLMLRELARRPRMANSLETLGLARLRWPLIDKAPLPENARSVGLDTEKWRDFLLLLVDRARSNFALDVPPEDLRWLLPRFGRRRNVVAPGMEKVQEGDLVWPFVAAGGSRIALVQMLAKATGLAIDRAQDRAVINEILRAAWDQLRPIFDTPGGTYSLNFSQAEIAPVTTGWSCPVTRRVITTRAFGMTPYGVQPPSRLREQPLIPLKFPKLPTTFPNCLEARSVIAEWLAEDLKLTALREIGIWNNLHDRAALLSPYTREAPLT
jgi:hypothetical protein